MAVLVSFGLRGFVGCRRMAFVGRPLPIDERQHPTPCRHSGHRESNGCFHGPTDIRSRGSTAIERHFLPFDGQP